MSPITPGRIYGVIAAVVLFAVFVLPPQIELNGTACSMWSFVPAGCEAGVRGVFRVAVLCCLFAGYLVSHITDRKLVVGARAAPAIAAGAFILFSLPLWIGLHAAVW